jgi:hypothetical protein
MKEYSRDTRFFIHSLLAGSLIPLSGFLAIFYHDNLSGWEHCGYMQICFAEVATFIINILGLVFSYVLMNKVLKKFKVKHKDTIMILGFFTIIPVSLIVSYVGIQYTDFFYAIFNSSPNLDSAVPYQIISGTVNLLAFPLIFRLYDFIFRERPSAAKSSRKK